jgi:hypothetical protein
MKMALRFSLSACATLIAANGLQSHAIAWAPSLPQASGRLEAFIVTARPREESLQQRPVAVTAIPGNLQGALTLQYDINGALAVKSITAHREFEQDTICTLAAIA